MNEEIERLVDAYGMAAVSQGSTDTAYVALLSAIDRVLAERDAARRRAAEWCPECEGTGHVKYHDDHTEGCQSCASFRNGAVA